MVAHAELLICDIDIGRPDWQFVDVPSYFFHLDEGGTLVKDDEGQELLDVAEARAQAIKAARDVLAAEVLAGRWPTVWCVYVEDAAGRRLFEVPLREAVEVC